jgi:hypothetical protein
MASPQADPICVRNAYLHHILLGKRHLFEGDDDRNQITKDGLIDALMVLHDECSADFLRNKDQQIARFVDRCKFRQQIFFQQETKLFIQQINPSSPS